MLRTAQRRDRKKERNDKVKAPGGTSDSIVIFNDIIIMIIILQISSS